MFILRIITSTGVKTNVCLSKLYNLIDAEAASEEFEKTMKVFDYFQRERAEIYAFIVYEDGHKVRPLYKEQYAYVMTSEGQTFENVSFKP